MARHLRLLLLAAVCGALLLTVSGCKDKEGPVEPPEVPENTLPFPDTPEQIMANFKTAYERMDINVYRDEVLADAYDFVLQMETVEEFQLPDNVFDRADELAIATKMFSGQPNASARVLTSIEIQALQPLGAWLAVPDDDPYFGAQPGAFFRTYYMLFYFNVQGDFRYEIRGNQIFYVVPDTVMHEGAMTPRYRLRGQVDQTSILGAKSTEGTTWGAVKALWY